MDMFSDFVVLHQADIQCSFSPIGASTAQVLLRKRCNQFVNVALSLPSQRFGRDPSYAGAVLGPCAGRIRGGRITISGQRYSLAQNDGANLLHGGPHGLSGHTFTLAAHDSTSATFSATLPDGLDGWPGNRNVQIRYALTEGPALSVYYTATTDRPTWIDLSNHIYWNLNGTCAASGASQTLQINADRVLYNDAAHLPISIARVDGGAFDFRVPRRLASQLETYAGDAQLQNACGYNNAFLLRSDRSGPSACLWGEDGAFGMDLYTDHPALVLYSGGYLGPDTILADGSAAYPSCGIALEAQAWPDAPNFPGAPFIPLMPGQTYSRFVRYRFHI